MEKTQKNLSEEKAKKLIVASTVGAILLVAILIMVMVYQLISIAVHKNRIEYYNAQIAEYERLIAIGEESKETYKLRWWIEQEARELGLVYPDDVGLN
jgi:hypothetical protein